MVITSGAEADRQNKYFLPISSRPFFGLLALSPGYWLCHLRCLFHDDGDEVDNSDDNDHYDNDDTGHCWHSYIFCLYIAPGLLIILFHICIFVSDIFNLIISTSKDLQKNVIIFHLANSQFLSLSVVESQKHQSRDPEQKESLLSSHKLLPSSIKILIFTRNSLWQKDKNTERQQDKNKTYRKTASLPPVRKLLLSWW